MQTIRITTPQNIDIDYEIAGLGERILARLLDLAVLVVVFFLGLVLGLATGIYYRSDTMIITAIVVYVVILAFYDLVFELFMNGQSLGKRIMKIKVISLDGSQPTPGQYLLRWIFRIIDFALIEPGLVALITAAINEKSQRLGDVVAGTMLIRTSPRVKMHNIVFMPADGAYQPIFAEAGQLNDRDIELIHEVISNYNKTRNPVIIYKMTQTVKDHLGIEPPLGMNELAFLQTIVKDYSHISAQEGIV